MAERVGRPDAEGHPGVGLAGAKAAGGASLVLGYAEAKRHKSSNRRARWRDVADALDAEFWPQVSPSFRLRPGQTVFTIGSCFARNIEAHLAALGCKAPMLDFRLPPEEFDGIANAAMNKFHPPAFRQCLEWTARIFDRDGKVAWADCEPLAFDVGQGRYFDLDMAATALPATAARFVERRQHIYDVFSAAFTADCLMMTPGLIEAWRDAETGLYMYGAPYHRRMLATPERWSFEVLSYQRCLDDMLGAIDLVRARNPGVNILVTTSPVPLGMTFTGRDVTIANAHSKAVLRAVCDAVLLEREGIDYFPSYEMATLSNPAMVWKGDRLHVSQGFIGKIVGYMLDNYMEDVDAALADFQRARALLASGDPVGAEQAALAALAIRPGHTKAASVLGTALSRQHRWGEAEDVLAPLAAAHPDRPEIRVELARVLVGAGRTAEAVVLLGAALSLEAFEAGDFLAADLVLERAPAETAVGLAQRAAERFPRHVEVHRRLVAALLRAGRAGEALAALRQIALLSHPPAPLLLQLARMLLETGELREALVHIDAALMEDPKHQEAAALRAELLADA
ncbi:MAG TPA: GSCFA domain-containing protein [Caulobacteraceae bacterium]